MNLSAWFSLAALTDTEATVEIGLLEMLVCRPTWRRCSRPVRWYDTSSAASICPCVGPQARSRLPPGSAWAGVVDAQPGLGRRVSLPGPACLHILH